MICQKCGRVVRPNNCRGRNESITERRYYCSCGFVNKTYENVVMTWKKTPYKPRTEAAPDPAPPVVPVETGKPTTPKRKRK
jgi:hypothetical protein